MNGAPRPAHTPRPETQTEAVLALLRSRGAEGLTALDALRIVGTMRLAARIADLRADGHLITSEMIPTPNGKRVARYVWHDPAECYPKRPTWHELRDRRTDAENAARLQLAGPDADGGVGDFALWNGTLCAVIADAAHEAPISPQGGGLLDLVRCGAANDQWSSLVPLVNLSRGELPQLGYWSYLVLALLVMVEGSVAILLGSVAASAGLMRPEFVFLAAAIGNLTADSLWYRLGYLGKTEWIFHFGRRLGIRPSLIEHLKQNMIKHATRVLFLAKLTVSFSIPALIAAGLLRIPCRRWFPYFIISETLWTGSLVLIGYYHHRSH